MSNGKTNPTQTAAVPRVRRGARHGASVAVRRVYRLIGQTFSRLLYPHGSADRFMPVAHRTNPITDASARSSRGREIAGTIPMASHNVLERSPQQQMDRSDYPIFAEIKLKQGRRVLATTNANLDGTFELDVDLVGGVQYQLEATIGGSDRIFPERVTVHVFVQRVPRFDTTRILQHNTRVRLRTEHHLNTSTNPSRERWERIDGERIEAYITPGDPAATLWLEADAAVVFNTFALNVEWMSQYPPDRYVSFVHNGRSYRIELAHLCICTCSAMILKYYGREYTVPQMAVEIARTYLTHRTNFGARNPDGSEMPLDPNAVGPDGQPVMKFVGGSSPHNRVEVVLPVLHLLLRQAPRGAAPAWWSRGSENMARMNGGVPSLHNFIARGWPSILVDDINYRAADIAGDVEHARVCHGVVVNHDGRLAKIYVHDPGRPERLDIQVNGSQSDDGWILVARDLTQAQVADSDYSWGLGEPPARRRALTGAYRQ